MGDIRLGCEDCDHTTEAQIAEGLEDRAARLATVLSRMGIPYKITVEDQEPLELISPRCIDGCAMPASRLVGAKKVVEELLDPALPAENPNGYAVQLKPGSIGWET